MYYLSHEGFLWLKTWVRHRFRERFLWCVIIINRSSSIFGNGERQV